jgi:hypothetical protein
VNRIVGGIAGEASNVNFSATISFDLSVECPAVSLSFNAILIVKYPIPYPAGELVSIGTPNPLLLTEFFNYPNSVKPVGCRDCRAGFRQGGNSRFSQSSEFASRKTKNVIFNGNYRPNGFRAFPMLRSACARI